MRKIMIALLFMCSSMVFAQYMPGGLVSQGTLMNTKTEIIRSGFDVWASGGIGMGAVGDDVKLFTSYHVDANAGYNVLPKMFLGAGVRFGKTYTTIPTLYVNMRCFASRDVNSMYVDLRLGKVIGGSTYKGTYKWETDTYIPGRGEMGVSYYKPSGATGGFSLGYIWNRLALDFGLDFIGAKRLDVYGFDLGDASEIDWKEEEYEEYKTVSVAIDAFIKVAYRF